MTVAIVVYKGLIPVVGRILTAKVGAEEKAYRKIPVINEFKDKDGNDIMMQQIQRNYDQIKLDAQAIINEEMNRIKNDPELCERLGLKDDTSHK